MLRKVYDKFHWLWHQDEMLWSWDFVRFLAQISEFHSTETLAIRVHAQSSLQRPHEGIKFAEQQAQLAGVSAWDQPVGKPSSPVGKPSSPVGKPSSLSREQLFEMNSRARQLASKSRCSASFARSCGRVFSRCLGGGGGRQLG